MKLRITNSELDENFPIALLDAGGLVVARFQTEASARDWSKRRHYEIEEIK